MISAENVPKLRKKEIFGRQRDILSLFITTRVHFHFYSHRRHGRKTYTLEFLNLPSSDLFLAINASSISGFGSFGSFDDVFWLCTWLCVVDNDADDDDDDDDVIVDDISIEDGAIWWFWNGCIIDRADDICKWDTWVVIPLFNADDTQTDINWYYFIGWWLTYPFFWLLLSFVDCYQTNLSTHKSITCLISYKF